MIVTPRKAGTNKAYIHQVVRINKVREEARFKNIGVRSSPFEIISGKDGIEVAKYQPGKTDPIDIGQGKPQKPLGGNDLGVIHHSEDPRPFSRGNNQVK